MANKPIPIFSSSLSDILFQLKNMPNLQVLSGCTLCTKTLNDSKINLPAACVFTGNVSELQEINRRERFIEFGSAVTLNQILALGKNRIPSFFYDAVFSVATYNIRNLATIGGNICFLPHKLSLFAPLLAMDAMLELKSFTETRQVAMSKFTGVPHGFILTKIRIPAQDWGAALFYRLGPFREINPLTAAFIFLADTSKGILGDLRIAFCGLVSVRSRELEHVLIGKRLPLSEKDILSLIEKAAAIYDANLNYEKKICPPLLKAQYLNLLRRSLATLT